MEQARLFYRLWADDYGLFLVRDDGRTREVAVSIEWEARESGTVNPEPPAALKREAVQILMNDLWSAGIRPSGQQNGEGVQKHLEDMRAIAFAKLNVEKP